jgi:hypothetical protein
VCPGKASAIDWRFWALLALFGLVVGLHLVTPRLDSDQAITGLMGLHILRGEFPIFFWGQHHAGVPESYGAAVTFTLLGVSRFALSLVPALAALATVLALHRTAALLWGPGAGHLAMLFATIVSPYVLAHYVRARAYYIEHLLLGQLVLLGAALWLARPLSEPARARALVVMGLAGGVGLYCGFQIVDALLPAALALLWVDPRLPLRRATWLAVAAFALGSLPFWIYNLTHDWATFATGARFAGSQTGGAAARVLAGDLLPVILGVQEYIGTPPYLPWPLSMTVPAVVAAAVGVVLVHAVWGTGRRRDPARAGDVLVLLTLAVTLGAVWYGRFLSAPRYLVPLAPPLALTLARATQLTWRRAPVVVGVAVGAYLLAVGVGLVDDLTVLHADKRAVYRTERAQDQALFAFLAARGLTRTYGYEYWLTARLTFDAGERIIVAEPIRDKHPPFTQAVDATRRPAYIVRAGLELFENWVAALQLPRFEHERVDPYTIFWDFAPPPPATPVSRAGWTVRTSRGVGEPASLVDGRFDTGWSSAPGPPASAWVEVDVGRPQVVSGAVLLTDQPEHVPQQLVIDAETANGAVRTVSRYDTGGFAPLWRNGALRTAPGRTLVVRFPPVEARRIRLQEQARGGTWAVAELFLLAPGDGTVVAPALAAGRRLEADGALGAALAQYREAIRAVPDDPEGYAEFARLAGDLGLAGGWPAERARGFARAGLVEEARALYGTVAAQLGSGLLHAELAADRARLAAAAGAESEARRLAAEATAVRTPREHVGAVFGHAVELTGHTIETPRVRAGGTAELAYHWRLLRRSAGGLVVSVQFLAADGTSGRFGDDHPLPQPIRGLDPAAAQHVMERRRLAVPETTPPGRYHMVIAVREAASGRRLHRWWHGVLPLPTRTVEVGTLEVLAPGV